MTGRSSGVNCREGGGVTVCLLPSWPTRPPIVPLGVILQQTWGTQLKETWSTHEQEPTFIYNCLILDLLRPLVKHWYLSFMPLTVWPLAGRMPFLPQPCLFLGLGTGLHIPRLGSQRSDIVVVQRTKSNWLIQCSMMVNPSRNICICHQCTYVLLLQTRRRCRCWSTSWMTFRKSMWTASRRTAGCGSKDRSQSLSSPTTISSTVPECWMSSMQTLLRFDLFYCAVPVFIVIDADTVEVSFGSHMCNNTQHFPTWCSPDAFRCVKIQHSLSYIVWNWYLNWLTFLEATKNIKRFLFSVHNAHRRTALLLLVIV